LKGDYPNNTRHLHDPGKGRTQTVVVEVQPGKRMVLAGDEPICLYFPYTYFLVRYMESISPNGKTYVTTAPACIGFSADRLDSTNGIIGRLPLSNYAEGYSFCLGSGSPSIGPYKSVRELVEAHMNAFWKSSFQMHSHDCEEWIMATKASVGAPCVKRFIDRRERTVIHELMGVSKNEQFFDFQSEPAKPKPAEPERPSGDRTHRRKKRKGSRRKT
jgi:hypothetical protein